MITRIAAMQTQDDIIGPLQFSRGDCKIQHRLIHYYIKRGALEPEKVDLLPTYVIDD